MQLISQARRTISQDQTKNLSLVARGTTMCMVAVSFELCDRYSSACFDRYSYDIIVPHSVINDLFIYMYAGILLFIPHLPSG
ncbi:hypothetical protein DERF_000422 [Dermatophagoides farinae]|uniref:Uncharacterized protein n=1 Tax=Dermatophagoides farinae TaxID=6954 RepID=A0A922I7B1_DERFA|nr:hypothetical protein DERF_000422 [Dermatophagoides farinae]